MFVSEETAAGQQDALRPLRAFISAVNAGLNDQSYAGADGYAYNRPFQFSSVGPYGTSVEGLPVVRTTAGGGLVLSPGLVLIGVGVAIALFVKRG
jgi:hypothetical protein